MLPTTEQNFTSVYVCQMLSNFYRSVELFRFNDRTGEIYIFAGEELQVVISRDGKWRFIL
ncbi:hypothetical protein C7B65_16870 [Phormidesmis priestleyi ULC007]|uniref:DUF6888 domain-containing protein n=1 Tax=Phormidesmis priestleyi ULC007 TaxID=1920490 RepID=A0A2T1DBZ9_9CYAN|nr:hypothetical protein C7B65_16870 [Phormidesmis priestleyi ULC007]PZO49360.1 MAG: hypothetical protein DCF14_14545 [Phormidesmis priestleyi]